MKFSSALAFLTMTMMVATINGAAAAADQEPTTRTKKIPNSAETFKTLRRNLKSKSSSSSASAAACPPEEDVCALTPAEVQTKLQGIQSELDACIPLEAEGAACIYSEGSTFIVNAFNDEGVCPSQ